MKNFWKILLLVYIIFSLFAPIIVWAVENENLNTGNSSWENSIQNNRLGSLWWHDKSFEVWVGWDKWIYYSLVKVAKDVKNVLFIAAWVYLIILVLKVLYSDNSEEESANFKKWIIWISIGLIITQSAYWFVNVMFDQSINQKLATDVVGKVLLPLLDLLQTIVSFFFIWIAIYTFYKMVTANGDEEKVKTAKTSIVHAIVWFIAIKISKLLVISTYWKVNCSMTSIWEVISVDSTQDCMGKANLSDFASTVVTLINWMNSFIWIIVVIMIIYTWAKVLLSAWDEEVLKKAKTSIIFILIWITILVANYLILTFFIFPESKI